MPRTAVDDLRELVVSGTLEGGSLGERGDTGEVEAAILFALVFVSVLIESKLDESSLIVDELIARPPFGDLIDDRFVYEDERRLSESFSFVVVVLNRIVCCFCCRRGVVEDVSDAGVDKS